MENICIISGSSRDNSQSYKVSQFIKKIISHESKNAEINLIDLSKVNLPDWRDEFWVDPFLDKEWESVSHTLSKANAFVTVTPEWAGMAPPKLMNLFLLCTQFELSHKPNLIVGVSAGMNGAYPVAELRAHAGKNNKVCFIPDSVVIKNVQNVLNNSSAKSDEDHLVRERLNFSIKLLLAYSQALRAIRIGKNFDYKKFNNGM